MANRSRSNSRRRKKIDPLTALLPLSIAHAIKAGLVVLPRSVHNYNVAIYAAFDGNFQPLVHCISKLETFNDSLTKLPRDSLRLERWAVGMANHVNGTYYVLTAYLDMLKAYHNREFNGTNTVPTGTAGNEHRPEGSVFGCEGINIEDDNRIIARDAI